MPNTIQPEQPFTSSRTRLAPSPTGALHLGNARTFLVNWALARQFGWEIVLRIEDLDGPRIKPGAVEGIQATLRWLGIDWDRGPFVQSADLEPYRAAMAVLSCAGKAFQADLTRGQVEAAASAPQEGSGEVRFPASLRPAGFSVGTPGVPFEVGESAGWRFATPGVSVAFEDLFAGPQCHRPESTVGDFIVWTKRATPSYQLAVVVDDHRQGITHIIRGDDLLDSAARQLLLYRALGLAPEPVYGHLPLVVGPDGKRLAKRHGDSRVDTYRAQGVPAEAVIGLIARWCGCVDRPRTRMSAAEFAASLAFDRIPRTPVCFTPEDDAWLKSEAGSSASPRCSP